MTEQSTTPEPVKPDWAPSRPLEYHDVYKKLSIIVASKPEGYAYVKPDNANACKYWHSETSEPGCLIGQLLMSMGASWEFLVSCDNAGPGSAIDRLINDGSLNGVFETRTGMALKHVQAEQDSGVTWSRCLESMQSFWMGLRTWERHLEDQSRS